MLVKILWINNAYRQNIQYFIHKQCDLFSVPLARPCFDQGNLFVDYPKPREVMSIFPSGTDNKPGNEVVSGESSKCD